MTTPPTETSPTDASPTEDSPTGTSPAMPPPVDTTLVGTTTPDRPRGPLIMTVWTVILVIGFAAVLTLGAPLPSAEDELAEAYRPPTPVTESVAIASADIIVRLQYPAMRDSQRTVTRRDDLGVDRFVIVYTVPRRLSLVRIAVEVESGRVTAFYLP
jgi:hypothetical protein